MEFKPKTTTFSEFIWNKEKREFLGRDGGSWGRVGLFYLVFYSFLASWFAGHIYFFLLTINEKIPRYQPGDGGSILQNAAIGYLPRPTWENIDSTLIWFKHNSNDSIRHWVTSLDDFVIDRYEREPSNAVPCSSSQGPGEGKVCLFTEGMLGPGCNRAKGWGYAQGSPCVLVKLNKMFYWEPEVYTSLDELPEEMPQRLKNEIKNQTDENGGQVPKVLWLSCTGEYPADDEYIPRVHFYPSPGFPAYYFPYTNQDNYSQPLVAVEFERPEQMVLINVVCKLWAKNIVHSRKEVLGISIFRLLID